MSPLQKLVEMLRARRCVNFVTTPNPLSTQQPGMTVQSYEDSCLPTSDLTQRQLAAAPRDVVSLDWSPFFEVTEEGLTAAIDEQYECFVKQLRG